MSLRYQITLFIRCRSSGNPSQQYNAPLVQQNKNKIKVNSTSISENIRQKTTSANWSSNVTIPQNINTTNYATTIDKVKSILNTNQTHQLKEGARIRDSLPGFINKLG